MKAEIRKAFYAGSFDPVTVGHMDVIKTAAEMFDEVIVGVMTNSAKKPKFSKEERLAMLRMSIGEANLTNVLVREAEGATYLAAREFSCGWMIRGLRLTSDFESELFLAFNNQALDPVLQTVFIPPKQKHLHISSTAVRELLSLGEIRTLHQYLPHAVSEYFDQYDVWPK